MAEPTKKTFALYTFFLPTENKQYIIMSVIYLIYFRSYSLKLGTAFKNSVGQIVEYASL